MMFLDFSKEFDKLTIVLLDHVKELWFEGSIHDSFGS